MESKLVKLILRHEDEEEVYVETPWATDLGDGLYRLENCPFYAYNLAFGDIVKASFSEAEEGLFFEKVVEKSGHQLVRIIFESSVEDDGPEKEHLNRLLSMGCSYEGANSTYICLDIHPGTSLEQIRAYLMAHDLEWEHASPSYDVLFPDDV